MWTELALKGIRSEMDVVKGCKRRLAVLGKPNPDAVLDFYDRLWERLTVAEVYLLLRMSRAANAGGVLFE